MRTSSMNKLLALSALVCTLGLAPQKADAVVILNGCAGGTFANDCGLNELLAGADFSVDNKRFTNWDLVLFGGTAMLDAGLIRVDPIDSRFNPGFMLTDTGTTLRATSVATSIQNELSFNVIVTGGDFAAITTASLSRSVRCPIRA